MQTAKQNVQMQELTQMPPHPKHTSSSRENMFSLNARPSLQKNTPKCTKTFSADRTCAYYPIFYWEMGKQRPEPCRGTDMGDLDKALPPNHSLTDKHQRFYEFHDIILKLLALRQSTDQEDLIDYACRIQQLDGR
ncbi:hypothetical protein T310_8479 [Rasamsonia emersonii CBS 393.64]|uniref:Uncharacterized protein n=1 Tax=Rasamsonia emersonii (strain ATCC 16479 / CBS 393.64 / IMI 116815) TaxID=1408163 RepID=A0A0F4YH45_RASE3|nr:hypothetical protein T310_8479 [Rasamsonia emersonii CBS 393.64]KKA17582.1 hypothetical protein T310_8479 [Rasamsonia emersonii CBS 393.64]